MSAIEKLAAFDIHWTGTDKYWAQKIPKLMCAGS